MKIGPRGCPETSVTNYQSMLGNSQKREDPIYTAAEARNHAKKLHWFKYETVTLVDIQKVAFEVMASCSMSEGHQCFKRKGCIRVHCRGLTVPPLCVPYSRYKKIFCFRVYRDLLVLRWIGSPLKKHPAKHRRWNVTETSCTKKTKNGKDKQKQQCVDCKKNH